MGIGIFILHSALSKKIGFSDFLCKLIHLNKNSNKMDKAGNFCRFSRRTFVSTCTCTAFALGAKQICEAF